MLSRSNVFAIVLTALLCAPVWVKAVIRNDNTVGDPLDIPSSVYITSTVNGATCTGTLVGDGSWVLTAGHCINDLGGAAGANFSILNQAGTTATGIGNATFMVPGAAPNNFTPDWGLIHINATLPGAVPLATGNPSLEDVVFFAGWGLTGKAPGDGSQLANSGGVARQGENVLNFVDNTNQAVGFDFDLAGGTAASPAHTINQVPVNDNDARDGLGNEEATTFPGDSGMGLLESISGVDTLVAVYDGRTAQSGINVDQVESYGTPVDAFRQQVLNTIPEPSSVSLLLVGLISAARRRRSGAVA
jgi:hypothetical protein